VVELAFCWAHVRRKFFDFHHATGSPIAAEALRLIAELYHIEARIRGRLPNDRARIRHQRQRFIGRLAAILASVEHIDGDGASDRRLSRRRTAQDAALPSRSERALFSSDFPMRRASSLPDMADIDDGRST
jgi:hypothetical protein